MMGLKSGWDQKQARKFFFWRTLIVLGVSRANKAELIGKFQVGQRPRTLWFYYQGVFPVQNAMTLMGLKVIGVISRTIFQPFQRIASKIHLIIGKSFISVKEINCNLLSEELTSVNGSNWINSVSFTMCADRR